jgi:hypothetical protein
MPLPGTRAGCRQAEGQHELQCNTSCEPPRPLRAACIDNTRPWQDPGLWTCPVNPNLMYIWCNIYLFVFDNTHRSTTTLVAMKQVCAAPKQIPLSSHHHGPSAAAAAARIVLLMGMCCCCSFDIPTTCFKPIAETYSQLHANGVALQVPLR